MNAILYKLGGGDRRSIGRSNEVVADVLDQPSLFKDLFNGLSSEDAIIRMRAADAVEKITAIHPEYLKRYKNQLIKRFALDKQQEVRWHVAQMLPRLSLDPDEQALVVDILLNHLNDTSRIVKVSALQALADIAGRDQRLLESVRALLDEVLEDGSAAMKARARKLVRQLDSPTGKERGRRS